MKLRNFLTHLTVSALLAIPAMFTWTPVVYAADECPTLMPGDLFKVPANSAVYVVTPDLKRKYFPNSEVFSTWYENFSAVKTIPAVCVDNYANGGGVNYRPGSRLIKSSVSPVVYAVGMGNTKHEIANEAIARSLYGNDWAKLVRVVPDVFMSNYAVGYAFIEAKLHDGQLVNQKQSDAMYYAEAGRLFLVSDYLPGNIRQDVRTVSEAVFASLPIIAAKETSAGIVANPGQGSVYAKTIVQDTPLELSGDRILEIRDTHFILASNVHLRDQSRLILRNVFLDIRKDHGFQYELKADDASKVVLENVAISNECNGAYNWNFNNYASLDASHVSMPTCSIWNVFSGFSKANIIDWNKMGGTICKQSDVTIEDSRDMELGLCYGQGTVIDEELPSQVTDYNFPNANEKLIDFRLHLKNSGVKRWGVDVQPGSSITIRNTPAASISISIGWPWKYRTVTLDGLERKLYVDKQWKIEDAMLHLVNTTVTGWEANVWEDNTVIIKNSDFSGSSVNAGRAVYQIVNATINGSLRATEEVQMHVSNSVINGDVTATDNATIVLDNTTVNGKIAEEKNGRVLR